MTWTLQIDKAKVPVQHVRWMLEILYAAKPQLAGPHWRHDLAYKEEELACADGLEPPTDPVLCPVAQAILYPELGPLEELSPVLYDDKEYPYNHRTMRFQSGRCCFCWSFIKCRARAWTSCSRTCSPACLQRLSCTATLGTNARMTPWSLACLASTSMHCTDHPSCLCWSKMMHAVTVGC